MDLSFYWFYLSFFLFFSLVDIVYSFDSGAIEIPGTSQCDLQEPLPVSPGLMSTVDGTGPFIVQADPACMYLDLLGYGLFYDHFRNLEKGGKTRDMFLKLKVSYYVLCTETATGLQIFKRLSPTFVSCTM